MLSPIVSKFFLTALLISSAATSAAGKMPPGWYQGELPVLRVQVDATRDRAWFLVRSGVHLYDLKSRQKLRHIALPDWHWAGEPFGCLPDLALGPAGEALISSDVRPALWRVDALTMTVSMHELVLDEDREKDVGFYGLAYSAEHGVFFAVSCSHGSLWRIDPLLRRAQKIPLSAPLTKVCGLSVRPRVVQQKTSRHSGLCARTAQGGWTIHLAPDQRSGYAFARPCTNHC